MKIFNTFREIYKHGIKVFLNKIHLFIKKTIENTKKDEEEKLIKSGNFG